MSVVMYWAGFDWVVLRQWWTYKITPNSLQSREAKKEVRVSHKRGSLASDQQEQSACRRKDASEPQEAPSGPRAPYSHAGCGSRKCCFHRWHWVLSWDFGHFFFCQTGQEQRKQMMNRSTIEDLKLRVEESLCAFGNEATHCHPTLITPLPVQLCSQLFPGYFSPCFHWFAILALYLMLHQVYP